MRRTALSTLLGLSLTGLLAFALPTFAGHGHGFPACSATANVLKHACYFEANDDYLTVVAACLNFADPEEAADCKADAREDRGDAFGECREVREARRDLCGDLGEAPYDPPFGGDNAGNFVSDVGDFTGNDYYPMVPGMQRVYWGYECDGGCEVVERITVTVTDKTKLIDGVTCLVVNDLVEEGEVDGGVFEAEAAVENTDDWYGEEIATNDVWYCGEIAENFELFEGDDPEEKELVDIEGSWKAARDEAKAGVLVPGRPDLMIGDVIRQEVAWGDAEDVIEIVSTTGTASSPAASCSGDCLVTRDFTPLEPGAEEFKYYAPGVGMIREEDPETGDYVELVEMTNP